MAVECLSVAAWLTFAWLVTRIVAMAGRREQSRKHVAQGFRVVVSGGRRHGS